MLTAEWARRRVLQDVAFHALHPGWVDTPGLDDGLPGFARLVRPILRTPAEGADTALWLSWADDAYVPGAAFWLDRRRRATVVLPWTRTPAGEADRLWETVAQRAGVADEVAALTTPSGRVVKIAIVGTGIAGLVCRAPARTADHDVTVFEADDRVGGHTNTSTSTAADGADATVDTGFIVYNDRNYPNFVALLDELGVATQPTEMSFGCATRAPASSTGPPTLNTLFAQRAQPAPAAFHGCSSTSCASTGARAARRGRRRGRRPSTTFLADAAATRATSSSYFLVPMGGVDLVGRPDDVPRFPARAYCPLHRQPRAARAAAAARSGARSPAARRIYVDASPPAFADRIRTDAAVRKVVRRRRRPRRRRGR